MALPRSSVIQLDDDGQDAQSELQFQDFTLGASSPDVATLSPSGSYSNYKENLDSPGDENEDGVLYEKTAGTNNTAPQASDPNLLGTERKEGSSFWKFSYYQSFFDVDTEQVVQRTIWSMIPLPGRATFLDRQIRPKPDLYGPFWIAATLVFSTAICANIANYLTTEGRSAHNWSYDFHKVSISATAIYSYVFLLPIILWGLMWYRQSSNRYTLLEILCVYGYSLAIYVPISVLWVIQVAWLQWILVIVGATLSGTVLIQTFWPIFRDENKKIAAVVLCLMLLFHTLLAVGFVTYFFQPPNGKTQLVTTTNTPTTSPPDTHSPTHLRKQKTVPTMSTADQKLEKLALVLDKEINKQPGKLKTQNLVKEQMIDEKSKVGKNESDIKSISTEFNQINRIVNGISTSKM